MFFAKGEARKKKNFRAKPDDVALKNILLIFGLIEL